MNNISSNGRAALRACAGDLAVEQLLRCRKIIVPLESNPEEISHRIVQDLRTTLKRVLSKEVEASSEEVAQAGALLLRVKALDPRRAKRLEAKNDEDEPVVVCEANNLSVHRPVADSYVPKLLSKEFWAEFDARCK